MQTIEITLGSTIQRFSKIALCLTTLLLPAPTLAQSGNITYIANEGVLIESGDKKVLIDALFNEFYENYVSPAESTRKAMVNGVAPYNDIDAVLTTHIHRDHFEANITGDFLKAHGESIFLSTSQAKAALEEAHDDYNSFGSRVIAHGEGLYTLTDEVNGITVHSFFIDHSPGIENMGFVLEINDSRILHLGDSNLDMERFKQLNLKQYNINTALIPYWYMSDETGQQIINEQIGAEVLVGIHFPKAPSRMALESIQKAYPYATVFRTQGEKVEF